jgi:hypothetical protein
MGMTKNMRTLAVEGDTANAAAVPQVGSQDPAFSAHDFSAHDKYQRLVQEIIVCRRRGDGRALACAEVVANVLRAAKEYVCARKAEDALGSMRMAAIGLQAGKRAVHELITLEQQVAAVAREVAMRKAAYPRRVAAKKMKQEKADHEVAAMEAVLDTLKAVQACAPQPAPTPA